MPHPDYDPRNEYFQFNIVSMEAAADKCRTDRNAPVAASTIKRACESGKLGYVLIAGRRCFSMADLDAWLTSNRVAAAT
jgi:hypothetical protein